MYLFIGISLPVQLVIVSSLDLFFYGALQIVTAFS